MGLGRDVSAHGEERGTGKVTMVVVDLVDVEAGSRPPFKKISRNRDLIRENFFRWDDVINSRPDWVMSVPDHNFLLFDLP
jgi:hypothetical protein